MCWCGIDQRLRVHEGFEGAPRVHNQHPGGRGAAGGGVAQLAETRRRQRVPVEEGVVRAHPQPLVHLR